MSGQNSWQRLHFAYGFNASDIQLLKEIRTYNKKYLKGSLPNTNEDKQNE